MSVDAAIARAPATEPMRIAMVHQPWNPAIPPVDTGSIAIWTYESANRLAAANEVTVYAPKVRGVAANQSFAGVRYDRVSVWPDPDTLIGRALSAARRVQGRPMFAQPGYYSGYRDRVAAQIAAAGHDIVHVHNLLTYPAAIRRKCATAKIVLHMHCEWLSQIPVDLALELVEPVDQLVACSEYLAARVNEHLHGSGKHCVAVPNGVDTEHFSPPPAANDGDANASEILFVGRVSPEKGLHDLIEAFAMVRRAVPAARLRIVGPNAPTPMQFLAAASDDPRVAALSVWYEKGYLDSLRRLAGDELDRSIVFHGPVPHGELPSFYRDASVLANPSISETFGMSLIESMACGRPVVGTEAGGMKEIIDSGETGFAVGVGDVAALAAALIAILENSQSRDRMGRQARAVAVDRYSWPSIAGHLAAIYRDL